jgi:hypothetical protein
MPLVGDRTAPARTAGARPGVQDRYVADVGGFGKYGLLRSLCAVEPTWGTRTFDKASSFTITSTAAWRTGARCGIGSRRWKRGSAFALRFRPGTGRAFFAVPAEAHREVLRERALLLVRNRCWSQHFELYGPEGPE